MQSIKKVLSGRRSSASSNEESVSQSPRSQASELSSAGATTIPSAPSSPEKKTKSLGETGAMADLDPRARGGAIAAHQHGHINAKDVKGAADLGTGPVHQTTQHLAEVKAQTHHVHQIEEVERQRNIERHQHHVQVHHQPLFHETHEAEKLHKQTYDPTRIHETHASTDKDASLLSTVAHGHGHVAQVKQAPVEKQIIDKGEKVSESVIHHVHNVIVPLVHHDTHEHHRTHSTIPIHHLVHEAPIVHEAVRLEPMSKDEYVKRGGILGSKFKTVDEAGLLPTGKCERKVDGVAEKLEKELNLKPSAIPS